MIAPQELQILIITSAVTRTADDVPAETGIPAESRAVVVVVSEDSLDAKKSSGIH
ncbi:hypothetical protein HYE82_10530 [Streptomyces sp. BR123]|uniref:hypothetical protein n=1 Tax=Streptomyces sp. BR123 TaxID=2749828 RepID=UPI0015C4B093|nr:hypothetical protein [Streptomyces sp. BR123]NXY94821.1 hypothetical protein [Streptomyces sp. BR123]